MGSVSSAISRRQNSAGTTLGPTSKLIPRRTALGDQPLIPLSLWSRSRLKRIFDLAVVFCTSPLTLPLLLITAAAVRLSSRGPVLFRQVRTGRGGRAFTIYKFRTMPPTAECTRRPGITTTANQNFTSIGPFLRHWKLDELPQLINVLRGEMSLVGPRPKLSHLHYGHLACRPGITGRATLVFAREEVTLSVLPASLVEPYYQRVIRPVKHKLDNEYMAGATFASDLRLIVRSILRQWDDAEVATLLAAQARPVSN